MTSIRIFIVVTVGLVLSATFINCSELNPSEYSAIINSESPGGETAPSPTPVTPPVPPTPNPVLNCNNPAEANNPLCQKAAKVISTITVDGDYEIYWDWEKHHDKSAPILRASEHVSFNSNTIDGPPRFFKDNSGERFAIMPMSVNYRVPINTQGYPARALASTDIVFNSSITQRSPSGQYYHRAYEDGVWLSGSCSEADYDNQIWIFGLWSANGINFDALAHQEFYPKTCPEGTTHAWVNSVIHLSSSDGGDSFRPKPYTPYNETGQSNSNRLVLIPKPSGLVDQDNMFTYGFYHPSNIVQEDDYYYSIVMINMLTGELKTNQQDPSKKESLVNGGFAMIRTQDTSVPGGWAIYTDTGWQTMNANSYIGMGGAINPKIFLEHPSNSPYSNYPSGGQNMTYSLVQHTETKEWLAFGYSNQGGTTVQYSLTQSLSQPNWGDITPVLGVPAIPAIGYPSISSEVSDGFVYQFIDNEPYLYFVAQNKDTVREGSMLYNLIQSGKLKQKPGVDYEVSDDIISRSVWRVKLKVETKEIKSNES